jgi:FKBP-type peptidyl-prolyl cis-trans isomerase 2
MLVEKDKSVSIHYTLYLENGESIESTIGQQPWEFKVGNGMALPDLEAELLGMKVGETKDIKLTPEQGYGLRKEDLLHTLERDQIPKDIELSEGLVLEGKKNDGKIIKLTVKSFDEKNVVFDLNHPLAGKNLIYKVSVVDIK